LLPVSSIWNESATFICVYEGKGKQMDKEGMKDILTGLGGEGEA